MTCAKDIATYNKIRSEQKLFQFLNSIDRQYDSIKRGMLRWDPLPSAEGAYAVVRKEMAHQSILGTVSGNISQQGVAVGLVSTGAHDSEGLGFLSRGRFGSTKPNDGSSNRVDKSKLKCTHCGMLKHTKEQCFKLVGFPDWWNDGHKKGTNNGTEGGKATPAIATNSSGGATNTNNSDNTCFGGMASAGFGDFSAGFGNFIASARTHETRKPDEDEAADGIGGHQDGSDHWAWH